MKTEKHTSKKNEPADWWAKEASPYDQIWNVVMVAGVILSLIVGFKIGRQIGIVLPRDFSDNVFRLISIIIAAPFVIFIGIWIFNSLFGCDNKKSFEEKLNNETSPIQETNSPSPEMLAKPNTEVPSRASVFETRATPSPQIRIDRFSATKFKEWRLHNKLKQRDVGKILGVPPSTISQLERGVRWPSAEMRFKIWELTSKYDEML